MTSTHPVSAPLVLLAEDTDAVRAVISRQLMMLGADVDAVPTGAAALIFAQKKSYDIVLTDLKMPDLDGWQLIKKIRDVAGYATTPIVVMTADPIDIDQLPDAYCTYIQKPVVIDHLVTILDTHKHGKTDGADLARFSFRAIDPQSLQEQMGALDAQAIDMLKRFPDMMQPLIDILMNATDIRDMKKIADTAHSLKGAARSIGALRLGEMCDVVQKDAENGMINVVDIAALQKEFDDVKNDLNQF